MKAKLTKVANLGGVLKTAVLSGKFQGKDIELGVTNTNTSWVDTFGSKTPKLGDDVEVDDANIMVANTGRYFINRVGADKLEAAVRMINAMNSLKAASV